jgi:phenylacetate-coenzyme A ligase PaaK-like adenylate-forming protein
MPNDLLDFITDPVEYFDWSLTRLWALPEADRQTYQAAGLKYRFEQLRDRIPYLKKLADRDGVTAVDALEDVVPLLFEHTVYKSYPASLLEKNRFGMLNSWLEKLSTVKLSDIDVSGCDSIDSWLDVMDANCELVIHHSSGTTGTVSLFPKAKSELDAMGKQYPLRFQSFGDPRPQDTQPKAHVIIPTFRSGGSAHFRINDVYWRRVAQCDDAYMHVAFPGRMSADILYLAGRIRAAKARGELDRIEIAPNLLGRLNQFETSQAQRTEQMREFLDEVTTKLAGQRVFLTAAPTYLWPLAEKGLAAGRHDVFAPSSVVSTGGGAKSMALPPDWRDKLRYFAGVRHIPVNYSMTEMTANNMMCTNGNYHIAPWIIPLVLDPDTSQLLPRTGTVTGRMAFYDLLPDTHWGGFITGDEVTITHKPCGCGRTGPHLASTIGRYSEQRGGDDKISCAASVEAHEEAMDFLAQIHAPSAA